MQFCLTQVFYKTILSRIALKWILCFQLQIAVRDHTEDTDDGWNIIRRGMYVDMTTICMYSWQAV